MVQAVLALHCAHFAPLMCGTAPLAAPAAQRLTHGVAQLLAPLSVFSLHPAGPQLPPGDPEAECCTVLRFLQLTLGLLAPLAWQAAVEPALFASHQQVKAGALWRGRRGLGAFTRCHLWLGAYCGGPLIAMSAHSAAVRRWQAHSSQHYCHPHTPRPPAPAAPALQQRQQAGLPPEQGPSAALYGLVGTLRHPAVRPRMWGFGLLTLGLCWTLAVVTSSGRSGGGNPAAAL